MFKHILLPTDGSDLSRRAVDIGVALAAKLQARVHAFHVVEPFSAIALPLVAEVILPPKELYTQQAASRAERVLEDVCTRAKSENVPCDGSYETNPNPYAAIVEAAAKHHCDLIVMASHGWRGVDRLLLGSETHKVILHCDVPVLVCH